MKIRKLIFLILSTNFLSCISAQGIIKGECKSYQYEEEPRVVTTEEYVFDKDMYLKTMNSKSVLDKKWEKEFITKCSFQNKQYIIDMSEINVNYEKDRNEIRSYCLTKEQNNWNLFYKNNLIAIISYSKSNKECYFENKKDNTTETFYKKENNIYTLFNTEYILKNGIFYEQNLDEYEYYEIDYDYKTNKYSINYSYEGLKSTYEFTCNYFCTSYDQTCLLWILRNDVNSFLLPYLFCKLDRSYHASSYLTEGTTTYEPEHLEQKDGLPWASGNKKGIGDIITIKEFEHKNPSCIKIMNGYQDSKHPDYYEKNSRVKKIKITNKDTKKSKTITIKDIQDEQTFKISDLGKGSNFDIEVLDVYNGTKYDDLCIQYMILE